MKYKDQDLDTYSKIIDYALKLKGAEQGAFVEAYAKSGPYALQNIGYFSGYYDSETALKIQEIFQTAHPIFGRRTPSAKEAFEKGQEIGRGIEP